MKPIRELNFLEYIFKEPFEERNIALVSLEGSLRRRLLYVYVMIIYDDHGTLLILYVD